MTRLKSEDIADIAAGLEDYDRQLFTKTGSTLCDIACRAADMDAAVFQSCSANMKIAIIPVTSGLGIVGGFSKAVKNIAAHIGFRSIRTKASDVAGLAEAFEKGADIIMLSDDDRFVAINLQNRRVIDNAVATARGFVAGLDLLAGGLAEKDILVIGCGPVGYSASQYLIELGACISLFDVNPACCEQVVVAINDAAEQSIRLAPSLEAALGEHTLIVDATPARDIIRRQHIKPSTYIAAPGVPCGLSLRARSHVADRLLHDPLQIGVATMIALAIKNDGTGMQT
jgi:pyrrolysine biosynthesis protein PylD